MTEFNGLAGELTKMVIKNPLSGLAAWFVEFGRIKTKKGRIITPKLNPMQRDICNAVGWCLANNVPIRLVIVKPRQKGCSTITMALLYWLMCMFKADGAIMGGKKGHAASLWKIFRMYAAQDEFSWGFTRDTNTQAANFSNGSSVKHETAKSEDAGRSSTYQCLCLTECAYWHEGEVAAPDEVLAGIMNCVPDDPLSCIIMESTARGPTGYFAQYFTEAVTLEEAKENGLGDNGFIKIFSPWFDHDDSREWHKHPNEDLEEKLIDALRLRNKVPLSKEVQDFLEADRKHLEEDRRFAERYPDFVAKEKEAIRLYDLSPDQVRWRRKTWSQKCKKSMVQLQRDFPATAEEAFYASSNQKFNIEGLKFLRRMAENNTDNMEEIDEMMYEANQRASQRSYGSLEGKDGRFSWQPILEPEKAYFTMWEQPRQGLNYLISVDTASGEAVTTRDPDKHSVFVIRQGYYDPKRTHINNGWVRHKVVARSKYECRWPVDVLIDMVERLHHYYGRCMVVPEYNHSSGGSLIQGLRDRRVMMYQRSTEDISGDVRSPKNTGKYGWLTTSASRNFILDNLEKHIREYNTEGCGLDLFDVDAVTELENFIVNKRGKAEAAPGHHDDDVISLAIGLALVEGNSTRYVPPSMNPEIARDLQGIGNDDRSKRQYS